MTDSTTGCTAQTSVLSKTRAFAAGSSSQGAIGEMAGKLVGRHFLEWATLGTRRHGGTGSGCRTAYGLSGCQTVHSLLHGGWT